jgi:hypothetical protein
MGEGGVRERARSFGLDDRQSEGRRRDHRARHGHAGLVALGALAVQSIGWLFTLIITRLADEISSASTIIVTLRDEHARLQRDCGGA